MFKKNESFEYNKWENIRNDLIKVFLIIALIVFGISYLLGAFKGTVIGRAISTLFKTMFSGTIWGVFVFGLIAGLFFLSIPIEASYIAFLTNSNQSWSLFVVIIVGLFFSFGLNYFFGLYLSNLSKFFISAKQFYSIKVKLNQYGKWAILGFNIVPFLPAQPLALICGVFKYNKTRFFVLWSIGWVVKLGIITIIFG